MKQEIVTVGDTHTGNTMDASGPVTTIVTWKIQEGREKQFETWRHEIEAAATKFPGHLGVNLIVPNNGSREYTVIFRFDTYEHLRTWQESDIRLDLLKKAEQFQATNPTYKTESGSYFLDCSLKVSVLSFQLIVIFITSSLLVMLQPPQVILVLIEF